MQNSFGKIDSILFIGCAQGFEVKYFRDKGVQAFGVDVSDWAIDNCEPESKEYVTSYDGFNFPNFSFNFDVVAHFDVLALVPKERRSEFIRNSTDLTKNGYFLGLISQIIANQKMKMGSMASTAHFILIGPLKSM